MDWHILWQTALRVDVTGQTDFLESQSAPQPATCPPECAFQMAEIIFSLFNKPNSQNEKKP